MKMKYTEQAVETLDDAGGVIANKNIEIEQLRQRAAELEQQLIEVRRAERERVEKMILGELFDSTLRRNLISKIRAME